MRRRAAAKLDSLELLLDTLCNTFGGVLFIAMLVVTKLQLSGNETSSSLPSTDDFDISAVQDLEETLETLKAELAVLRKATRRQSDEANASAIREIEDRISASEALWTRLEQATERQDQLVLELRACLGIPQLNEKRYDFPSIPGKERKEPYRCPTRNRRNIPRT
jgi:DNA repair exonuclease SbcCD ATPase subunit